jgi:hypothetical protein
MGRRFLPPHIGREESESMPVRSVGTLEYEADIKRLLERRLKIAGSEKIKLKDEESGRISAVLDDENEMNEWCSAIAQLLLRDLAHLEVARLVNELPLSLSEKHMVLPEAIKNAHNAERNFGVTRMLTEHFKDNPHLNLEGFMRFRMKDVLAAWELCVDRAAEEWMLKKEYYELMGILSAFVQLQPPRIKEISLCLNPDGSCTLIDDEKSRVDYSSCTGDGVVSVLVGLAPERIIVYDLSGGKGEGLSEALLRVFADRIRFYR